MPLIGFTVFNDEVRDGTKRQTIRKHRKLPIKVGDKLYLYWHLGKKDCRLLRVEKCVEIFTMSWAALKISEEIAKLDGFKSSAEMRQWFTRVFDSFEDEELFDIIRW